MKRRKQKFLRLGYTQYSKLGLRRKKKQIYRRANGIDNKVRLKMKGHLRNVNIGFRTDKKERGQIKGLKGVIVRNLEELKKIKKNEIAVLGKFGDKKKMQIAEYALKNNIQIANLNPKTYIEKIKAKLEARAQEKKLQEEKKKIKDKRAKETEKKKEEKTPEKDGEKSSEQKEEIKEAEKPKHTENKPKENKQ